MCVGLRLLIKSTGENLLTIIWELLVHPWSFQLRSSRWIPADYVFLTPKKNSLLRCCLLPLAFTHTHTHTHTHTPSYAGSFIGLDGLCARVCVTPRTFKSRSNCEVPEAYDPTTINETIKSILPAPRWQADCVCVCVRARAPTHMHLTHSSPHTSQQHR